MIERIGKVIRGDKAKTAKVNNQKPYDYNEIIFTYTKIILIHKGRT